MRPGTGRQLIVARRVSIPRAIRRQPARGGAGDLRLWLLAAVIGLGLVPTLALVAPFNVSADEPGDPATAQEPGDAAESSGEPVAQAEPHKADPSKPKKRAVKNPKKQPAKQSDAEARKGAEAEIQGDKARGEKVALVGRLIRISGPINDKVDSRVRRLVDTFVREARREGKSPVLVLEIHPGRTKFGQALDLAQFLTSPSLDGVHTVAYLPERISGHSVLVAMACTEIFMHPDAEIGNAGEFEPVIAPSIRDAYEEIARRRKTVPVDVALKMLDKDQELLVVETDVKTEYVLRANLEALRQRQSFIETKVSVPSGEPGVFSADQTVQMGFKSHLASDRNALARDLQLPPESVEQDISIEGDLRPVRIALKGPITPALVSQIQNMIDSQVQDADANFICLWIDSPGGSPTDSSNLANFLLGLDSTQRRTVAYIPSQARADAAYVALACDQIVMHDRAVLGGSGDSQLSGDDIEVMSRSVAEIARQKHHSPALAAAMVDPALVVFEYTRADGVVDYFSADDAKQLPDADQWRRGRQVTTHGQPLRLTGVQAEEAGLARDAVGDFAEFKALYGLEDDPALLEPGWADFLIDALNSPGVSWFLLLLGGAALYAELQSPGIGLGGLIAAVCFLLYFWSAYLGGTAGWLEVLLFVAGLVFLMLEVFALPGFGVFGLAGGLMVVCSLILASQTFVLPRNDYQLTQLRNSLFVLTGAGAGTVFAAALIRRFLPHAPMFNRMLLAPPSNEELSAISRREAVASWDHLLGREGTSTTPLVPGGKARFHDELVDVVADGEFVDRGRQVRVTEVRGNRVVVRAVS